MYHSLSSSTDIDLKNEFPADKPDDERIFLHSRFHSTGNDKTATKQANIQFDAKKGTDWQNIWYENNKIMTNANFMYKLIDQSQLAHVMLEVHILSDKYKILVNNQLIKYNFLYELNGKVIDIKEIGRVCESIPAIRV
jgi:hypothetical protein